MTENNQKQLGKTLLDSAGQLRGAMDASAPMIPCSRSCSCAISRIIVRKPHPETRYGHPKRSHIPRFAPLLESW